MKSLREQFRSLSKREQDILGRGFGALGYTKNGPAGDRNPKQTAGGRRGEGEKAGVEKVEGEVPEQYGMEAPPGQSHGGPCDFARAVALSSEEKEKVFFVNTIALSKMEP